MMPEKSIEKAANNITDFEKSLKKYTGLEVNVKYFRPPSGYYSERDLEIADQLGKISVFWGFAYMDYEDKSKYSSDEVYHMLCDNLKNGQIYQLHLRNPANTDALEKFIDEAKSRGYSFGLISDIA